MGGFGAAALMLLGAAAALLFANIPYPNAGQSPALPAPFGEERPDSRSRFTKLLILLILLVALGWIIMLGIQYFITKEPINDPNDLLPGVLVEDEFRYVGSIEGVERPMGVAISDDGTIYVSESAGERMVRVFNGEGVEIGALAPPDTTAVGRVPLYIAISPDNEVYVSDRLNHAIYMWAADGSFVGTYQPQSVAAEDWHPLGLAFDARGNLYVTDATPEKHRVMVFDSSGALKLEFGKEGTAPGDFWFPNGVAVDGEGRIYVADGNNGRLQVFDAEGNLLDAVSRGFAKGDLSMPRGVTLDGKGHLFVADTTAHAVKSYDISGDAPDFVGDIGHLGSGDGEVRYPNGVALADGTIYVADRENSRVQIWSR